MPDDKKTVLYTKDDFLTGTKPYEEVYKNKDNQFELDRAIERMSEVAKLVKVSNFKTLYKAYEKTMKSLKEPEFIDNATDFDGQELELDCGVWQANDYGICKESPFGGEIYACVHALMPVQRLINIDTGIEKLKLAYKKGGRSGWKYLISDRKQLASASQIVALADYGIAVTSENAKYMVQYLHDIENLNYDRIPECHSVSRLGWIGDEGFSPYVDNLIFDGDISFKHHFDAVIQKGSYEKWLDTIKDIRAGGNIPAKILIAASFASVLVGPCNCLPFFVHLWGGTETGKTVGLMLATSVWANPELGKYIHTFNSTSVAQELSAGFVNNLPLMLDELQIQKDKKDFDNMIYQLSEGVGRARGQKTGGLQKTQTWANCIMTTGEQPISSSASGGGAVNRIIEIACDDTKLFSDPGKLVDVIRKNYGHAGKKFVEILSDPKHLEFIKDTQKSIYKDLLKKNVTEKQALAASLILTADAFADAHIFKDNNGLAYKDVVQFLASADDVSAGCRGYNWLLDWLAQNSNKFKPSDILGTNEVWGAMKDRRTYIIRTVFNKACIEAGYNPYSFLSWMKRKGLTETAAKGLDKSSSINGSQCHCVVLKNVDNFTDDV